MLTIFEPEVLAIGITPRLGQPKSDRARERKRTLISKHVVARAAQPESQTDAYLVMNEVLAIGIIGMTVLGITRFEITRFGVVHYQSFGRARDQAR